MIVYDIFFRRYVVRMPSHLFSPHFVDVNAFSFPKKSLHHYTAMDNIVDGPSSNEMLYRDIEKKIFVYHVEEIVDQKGEPRRITMPLDPVIRNWHIRNKRFRRSYDIAKQPSDENTLAVVNYSLLPKVYRYMKSIYTEYNKWWNLHKTVFAKAASIASQSDRNQFIFLEIPQVLPSYVRLNTYVEKFNQQMLQYFRDPRALMILEFWKWLDPKTRPLSMLSVFNKEEDLNKINIIFQDAGKLVIYNLGILNNWIDTGEANKDQKVKISVEKMRKCFLKTLMNLMEFRTVDVAISSSDTSNEEDTKESDLEDSSEMDIKPNSRSDHPELNIPADTQEKNALPLQVNEEVSNPDDFENQTDEQKLKQIDEDLKQLELIEKEKELEESISQHHDEREQILSAVQNKEIDIQDFNQSQTPEESLKEACDNLAESGLISAAEYRKYIKNVDQMSQMPSPKEGVLMKDYIQVTQEDTDLKEKTVFKDNYQVVDKSMLESSLEDCRQKYIENVLPKDIVRMGMSLQKSGFVVTNYKIDNITDISGDTQIHTLKINPLVGKPSTLRIKIPAVKPNGTIVSGQSQYFLRWQRVDQPIRKIAPNRVALTSYYGKTFVTRSEKKAVDYAAWLQTNINNAILNGSKYIQRAYSGNVFDNLAKLPRSYTAVAMSFRKIEADGYTLYFDYQERHKVFTPEQIKLYEKNGRVLLGKHKDGRICLIDPTNTLYEVKPNSDPEPMQSLEKFLGFDESDIPIEFAQTNIFGQPIAVGIILAYLYGFEKLLTLLRVHPRKVMTGSRLNLQEFEYAIAFSDETYIFSKDNALATLILGGFTDFAKSIRSYSVYQFDQRAVYLNILESKKITTRYLKEVDLIDALFVDPITETILKQMNEPTTYRALLVRSCELLLTDAHPDPLDLEYQRIRGYERIAGAIYTEVVKAVRDNRSKLGRSTSTLDLHPFAVWKRVMTDPAMKIVEDINPIGILKQVEAVTFSGEGGRSSRSLTRSSREYHKNDLGVISESTVDSSDVAINTYTTANPNFISLYGLTKRSEAKDIKATQLYSTSALLAVGADTDD